MSGCAPDSAAVVTHPSASAFFVFLCSLSLCLSVSSLGWLHARCVSFSLLGPFRRSLLSSSSSLLAGALDSLDSSSGYDPLSARLSVLHDHCSFSSARPLSLCRQCHRVLLPVRALVLSSPARQCPNDPFPSSLCDPPWSCPLPCPSRGSRRPSRLSPTKPPAPLPCKTDSAPRPKSKLLMMAPAQSALHPACPQVPTVPAAGDAPEG